MPKWNQKKGTTAGRERNARYEQTRAAILKRWPATGHGKVLELAERIADRRDLETAFVIVGGEDPNRARIVFGAEAGPLEPGERVLVGSAVMAEC